MLSIRKWNSYPNQEVKANMTFETTRYQKNLLVDLQEAWANLRESVIQLEDNELRKPLLFYLDECLNWSHVQHLPAMKHTLHLINHIAYHQKANEEVQHYIERIRLLMNSLFTSLDLDWQI